MVGLCYHLVSDHRLRHVSNVISYKSVAQFETDLLYMRRVGNVVSYDELVDSIEKGTNLPPNAFHISFDDGYAECYSSLRPLLLKYNMPCTFFISPSFLDNKKVFFRNAVSLCIDNLRALDDETLGKLVIRTQHQFNVTFSDRSTLVEWVSGFYTDPCPEIEWLASQLDIDLVEFLHTQKPYMSLVQVLQLARDGFTIGAHTLDHPAMDRIADVKEIEKQVVESCHFAREISQRHSVPFAIPFEGSEHIYRILDQLKSSHSCIGLIFDTHGVRLGLPKIVNRVVADHTQGANDDQSNLPLLLLKSYASNALYSAGLRK